MKKIFILLFGIIFFWIGYNGISFYLLLDRTPATRGNIRILDRHGEILAEKAKSDGFSIEYTGSLKNELIKSIITIEDNRFYNHFGFDIIGKLGAIRDNYEAGMTVRGGSTIGEQYIKNTYFPNQMRNVSEKLHESIDSIVLGLRFSKDDILRKYLNTVYMGNGIYGVGTAIEYYFHGKDADTLSPDEIVEIITRIHSPNLDGSSKAYGNRIAKKLYGKEFSGKFSQIERPDSINKFPLLTERILSELKKYCEGKAHTLGDFLTEPISQSFCTDNHLTLHSSISLELSNFSENTMESIITPIEEKNIKNSAIYIKSVKEGKILAYIGNRGTSTESSAIDMIQKRRSVGSVLKPFVYKLALESSFDGESIILDDVRIYDTENTEKKFVPENYIPKSYGPIRLKEALGNSLNSATVRLSEYLGIGKIYESYKRAGLDLDHESGYYGYGISLGSVELTLENLVHGYESLTDITLPENFLIYNILSEGRNREKTFGVTSILNTSIPMAVKTGTSTDFHDNWTIAYNENIIIGVWVGNADGSSMNDVSGVTGAGPIFHHIAEYMIEHGFIQNSLTEIPKQVEKIMLCLDNSCTRKEEDYRWKGKKSNSRIFSKIYMKSDFIHSLTEEEIKKWKIR